MFRKKKEFNVTFRRAGSLGFVYQSRLKLRSLEFQIFSKMAVWHSPVDGSGQGRCRFS